MVVEEVTPTNTQSVKSPGVPQDQIDNIMGGISNTGSVRMNNHRRRLKQSFDIIKRLGQGTYGKVQLGINKETGQEVAIKTIKKCKIEAEADLIRIRREVQIMSSVQHPNIIHIYEVFESREKLILVMEFAAGGELYDYLSERKVLSEGEARRIFRQISTAVYYCHKHKICHRDLKLENILLDEHGNAKIADFGLSNVFDDRRLLQTFCGSPLYASPEIVKGTPYQGPEVDCWSLGVLLYTLVYGSMPFDGSNFKRLVKQISTGDYYEPKEPSPASPLIREMLTVCPRKRATIEQICNHWWVNEGYKESCLDLAEDLANQTPVRLDVLLSLSPAAVTAEQLVVPSSEPKTNERVPRSHSVGSIRDMAPAPTTEAERRILDMVAAGGEAALMPSPTRTITPAHSPVQPKRKLETTVSTENAAGALKKKERPTEQSTSNIMMEVDQDLEENALTPTPLQEEDQVVTGQDKLPQEQQLDLIENMCDELMQQGSTTPTETKTANKEKPVTRQRTVTKLDAVKESTEEEANPAKVIKNFVNKHKTADLVAAITSPPSDNLTEQQQKRTVEPTEITKVPTERRRSRILETAEKFQNLNNTNNDKQKKVVSIPGVSVGNFKKEFERRASLTGLPSTKFTDKKIADESSEQQKESAEPLKEDNNSQVADVTATKAIENCDSKSSIVNFSLEEARRSMENSIALLNQAKDESTKEVEQLCAKTESVAVSDTSTKAAAEREKKLRNAREIISNAIQPGGRLCMGARKPPVPYGMNGRSVSGSVVPSPSAPVAEKLMTRTLSVTTDKEIAASKAESLPLQQPQGGLKTSKAEITLKSATLPRRKTAKAEVQLDIKPKIPEQQPMRFSTEMQHEMPDLRSAPARDGPSPYSPPASNYHQRATSLEPQPKEHFVPIQKPSFYSRTNSNTLRSGSSSRQSTIESEGDTTPSTVTSSQFGSSSQPIKKSPREFIIPIAVEGGGYVTPRSGSVEPSESNHTTTTTASNSTFSHIKPRRFGTLLSEMDSEEESPFQKLRMNREGQDDPRFTLHRLRSSRPVKKLSQDSNDSQSSGEDDDEDGFEILTAENLFSTLLQRVRALTNRLNVNNDISSGFGNSRLLNNMRQPHSSFWNHDPFGSRLNKNSSTNSATVGGPSSWRHNLSRNLNTDMDSMFSRSSATLPRGKSKSKNRKTVPNKENNITDIVKEEEEALDLADLDLSRLRLTKKDLETLSTITPELPKCFQEQLLAKLPPTQARKLSRTLSMQNNSLTGPQVYKRSLSGGRELSENTLNKSEVTPDTSYWGDNNSLHNKSNSREDSVDRNSQLHRRSISRSRCDDTTDSKSRSYRSSSDCSKSLYIPSSADINDKYKYYSPYVNNKNNNSSETNRQTSPYKRYDSSSVSPMSPSCLSPTKEIFGRPPSGCMSPPLVNSDNLNRRRSSKRRLSRFLRQDTYDLPSETSSSTDNAYLREKNMRERETQSVLREIREKSRDRERNEEKRCKSVEKSLMNEKQLDYKALLNKSNSQIDKKTPLDSNRKNSSSTRHIRNKSIERFCDLSENVDNNDRVVERRRRSYSRPRELDDNNLDHVNKCVLANQILEELQILSAAKKEQLQEKKENSNNESQQQAKPEEKVKVKKSHSKEKSSKKSERKSSDEVANLKPSKSGMKKEKKSIEMSIEKNNEETLVKSTMKASEKCEKVEKNKKDSKLLRPKSYPSKEPDKFVVIPSNNLMMETLDEKNSENVQCPTVENVVVKESNTTRPKSYPNSKLTPPKELKKFTRSGPAISAVMEKLMEKSEKNISKSSSCKNGQSSSVKDTRLKSKKIDENSEIKKQNKSEKEIKLNKSSDAINTQVTQAQELPKEIQTSNENREKEKSPEKKPSKGLLYALGQKFEKLRENAKSKEKKSSSTKNIENASKESGKLDEQMNNIQKSSPSSKKKSKSTSDNTQNASSSEKTEEKTNKIDKKSRIDTMIKSLKDRSLTRAPVITESGYIKRAISVEDLPSGTLNKCGVNRVFGLFRKFEKDGTERKVMNTRSTSNIETQGKDCISNFKERPKSGGFVSRLRHNSSLLLQKKEAPQQNQDVMKNENQNNKKKNDDNLPLSSADLICADCIQENKVQVEPMKHFPTSESSSLDTPASVPPLQPKSSSYYNKTVSPIDPKICSKEKRKGLMLDFSKLDNNCGNYNNNNPYLIHGTHEINRNHLLAPSSENTAYYSSDSKSPYDDCASSSTFLSPSEEPELSFDNWSVCSEDNFIIPIQSPSISCVSTRGSQHSSPSNYDNSHPESVIDRIKRRSFYCRFNEKKPKRQSNIVGPAARDYYRESAAKIRSRPPDQINLPDNDELQNTHDYLKAFKPVTTTYTDLRPPPAATHTKSTLDYLKPRKSLNDILPTSSSSLTKRYTEGTDYLRPRAQIKENGLYNYNSYNPKRRCSFTSNGVAPITTSTVIDGYATLGRRSLRPYDHRSISLLDSSPATVQPSISSTILSSLKREPTRQPTELRNLSRSNSHYRNSSMSRSPTNM